MSEKFKKSFRGYLIDHHSPAPPTVHFGRLDMEEYERFYQEANINSLMVYTKDHWGYSYYDTAVGTKHPGLSIDYIGEVSRILRKNNIEFNAYYCLEYDTLAPMQHPEWAIRDKDGNAVTLKNPMAPAKWGMPCYETGYRTYVLKQLEEIVGNYHPDSLFLDIFGKSLCYCPDCRRKFRERYGYELPQGESVVKDGRICFDFGEKGRDVNRFLEDCAYEMLQDVLRTVKSIDPELKVTINFAALYPKRIRDLLDYQFTEPWAGNWLSAAYSRDTSRQPCPQLGPGDVSEVYNYRPDAVYELAGAQIAANGCRVFFYSGSQHTDGTLEHTEAKKVGRVYREVETYEELLQNRQVIADIAIIQSETSSMARSGSQVVMNAIGRYKQPDLHKDALKGAMALCDYSKYSWKIVPEQELTAESAKNFRCIILAGVYCITEELKTVLKEFTDGGGCLLAAGECGLYETDGSRREDFALADILGCSYKGEFSQCSDQQYGGYLQKDADEIFQELPDTYPPMGNIQYRVEPTTGAGMGKIMLPCTRVTDTTWVNWWCPPPSMEAQDAPAVVRRGNCFYVAFDMFQTYQLNLNRQLFTGILKTCLEEPQIFLETDFRETISYSAYRQGENIIIHIISNLAEKTNGDAPAIRPGILKISDSLMESRTIRQICPSLGQVNTQKQQGYTCVVLPEIEIHQIFVLEAQGE